ncbi:MAG: hypothetical protein ACK55Z_35025, partial [bacterium]
MQELVPRLRRMRGTICRLSCRITCSICRDRDKDALLLLSDLSSTDSKLFEVLGEQNHLKAALVLLARSSPADLDLFAQ